MWSDVGKYCALHAHVHRRTQRERERETFVSLHCIHISGFFLSARPDKGPLQTRSSQGCHLLANMLSVIFCALGSPSKAGPHGSPAHANRTNPSRTCLSVSLSPSFSCLLNPPPPSFFSSVRQAVLSLRSRIYFSLCPLVSPPLCVCLSFSVPELQGRVSAKCSRAVVNLCVFPCVVVDSPSLLIQRWQAAVGSAAAFAGRWLDARSLKSLTPWSTPPCSPCPCQTGGGVVGDFCFAGWLAYRYIFLSFVHPTHIPAHECFIIQLESDGSLQSSHKSASVTRWRPTWGDQCFGV